MKEENDKMERLLQAMERPDDFTDEELEALFADEEVRDCYNLAIKAEQGFRQRRRQPRQAALTAMRPKPGLWWRIAAAVVCLVMLSGITIAAILSGSSDETRAETASEVQGQQATVAAEQPADSLRTFENEELEAILTELAAYYHLRTHYGDDQVRHIRLYIKWNKNQSAATMVERLNGFEKVNVTLDKDLLSAE